MIAQGAHASVTVVTQNLEKVKVQDWLQQGQTKIALSCESEEELIQLHTKAEQAGIITTLITDAGLTEFDGPTKTAVAIGPDRADKIDKITRELKLL